MERQAKSPDDIEDDFEDNDEDDSVLDDELSGLDGEFNSDIVPDSDVDLDD